MPIGRRTRWATNHQAAGSAAGSANAPGLLADAYGTQPINGPLARTVCWMESTGVDWQDGECHGDVSSASKIWDAHNFCIKVHTMNRQKGQPWAVQSRLSWPTYTLAILFSILQSAMSNIFSINNKYIWIHIVFYKENMYHL